jgi:hypothetical protein
MTKILAVSFVFLLSGCVAAPAILTGLGVTGVAVQETTGRTLTDHTVSTINGRDCRVSRSLDRQDICQDPPALFQFKVTTTGVEPSTTEEIQAKYRQQ